MIGSVTIDHLVFRISSFDQTERFYNAILGPPTYRDEESLMYIVNSTRIFFTLADEAEIGTYDKEGIGLNHFAFGVSRLAELEAIQAQLDICGIENSGITIDQYGLKEFIWLDDPDGLRVEFYLRSA
jgi:catechol-2,3-dioxygenase